MALFSAVHEFGSGPKRSHQLGRVRVRCLGPSCRASHCASRQLMTRLGRLFLVTMDRLNL